MIILIDYYYDVYLYDGSILSLVIIYINDPLYSNDTLIMDTFNCKLLYNYEVMGYIIN